MKNILKILLIISVFFAIGFLKIDAASKVDIHLFYGDYCPHCAKEIIMLKDLAKKDQRINLLLYEMSNPKNHQLAVEMAKNLNTTITGVPFTVIGDKYFTGYGEGYNKEAIIKAITEELGEEIEEKHNYKFKVPLLGEVETKDLSLPAIAILMGILDGFNPCAMWVLLF